MHTYTRAMLAAIILVAAGCSSGGTIATPPTPAPPVVPANPPVAAPHALAFVAVGAPNAQTAAVTETGYTGALTETDTCTGIAVVTASGSIGPSVTYTIAPTGAGSCTVTVQDVAHASDAVAVVVSPSGVIIQ